MHVMLREKIVGAYEALRKGIFITATCLIIFIALRNSLIWHLEQVWGASGSFFSAFWMTICRAFGGNQFLIYVIGTNVLAGLIPFALANAFFTYLDITGRPAFLHKYKIQEEKNLPVSWELYKKAARRVLLNNSVVGVLFNLSIYPLAIWRGLRTDDQLPSFPTTILHLVVFLVAYEPLFYYLHRLFHHPRLYRHIHKTHHEWTAPISITSVYCHPIEHYVVNLIPLVAGPLLMGSHLSVTWLWFILAILSTTISHCGYHLPFLSSPEAHDFHHDKFVNNFGATGVLDRLHGTDTLFRRSKSYDRHIMTLSMVPVKRLFPDPPKGKGCHCD